MRIAVNLRLFTKGEIGGLENYLRHIVPALATRAHAQGQPITLLARESEVDTVKAMAPEARVIAVRDELDSEREVSAGAFDLLFCPLLVLEPLHPRIPSAVLIPDLQHEFLPESFDAAALRWRKHHYKTSAANANLVFTLSQHARDTILRTFSVDSARVIVVEPGVDPEFFEPPTPEGARLLRSNHLASNFIYYPANFWPHKNHDTLLAAMRILLERHPDLVLVCTGAPSTGARRVSAHARTLGVHDRVRLLGYLPRPLVVELYRHARALVFPSRFEGFGIPIAEAFAVGTPVVTSSAGSCVEVAGDAALLVDESDPVSIATAVSRLLDDPQLVSEMSARGKARAVRFTWSRALEETLTALDRIAGNQVGQRITVNTKPLVSVVTPSYNMAAYLEQTIQSVLGQDYPNIEYIVMDGGSRDGSREILEKYKSRLSFVSAPDKGQADALNRGFAQSRGAILAFLNADDTYLPGAVSTAVRYLTENRSAGAVYGEGYYVDGAGQIIARYPTQPFQASLLERNCFICQPSTFMRREVFESAGAFDANLHFGLDYDLWIRLAQVAPMVKVDDYLATSRLHDDNKTLGQRGRIYREIMAVARRHYGYVSLDWLLGYASYLTERRVPGRFESSRPSLTKSVLALVLGLSYNGHCASRFLKEWSGYVGLARQPFEGRWDDGWISKRYVRKQFIPAGCRRIRIEGRHLLPHRDALRLSLVVGRRTVSSRLIANHGPFQLTADCAPWMRGAEQRIELRASAVFQPIEQGDRRPLSCIVDGVHFDTVVDS